MTDSLTLYNEALNLQKANLGNKNALQASVKNSYLQILTTVFYELITKKNSPLISAMCRNNQINFDVENFEIDLRIPRTVNCHESSGDMYYVLYGLNTIASKDLNACDRIFDSIKMTVFNNARFDIGNFRELRNNLKSIDTQLKEFLSKENSVPEIQVAEIKTEESSENLSQNLNNISQSRKNDDEKIIAEIKKLQSTAQLELKTIQDSLKKIAEIRDEIDFRSMKEPVNQLIQLYYKLDDNLKRHPQEDIEKGYTSLIKRCERFLEYITQSLKMLGVEVIDNTGEIFNPDKNKFAEGATNSLDSIVTKINRIGFTYKGQVIEKAEVEVEKKF